jgi:tetratricopeptide (TPR) repeat protein
MLDHYAFCPCGSGKKIKFCCSNDILSDLDRIMRLVEGKQLQAAVDQINHVMSYKGRRPALLAMKTNIQLAAGDADGANQTVAEWLQRDPRNIIALNAATSICAARKDLAGAIERLSRVFEYAESYDMASVSLLSSMESIAHLMIDNRDYIGALWYLNHVVDYQRMISDFDPDSSEAADLLTEIQRSRNIAPIAKQEFEPRDCPETVVWRDDFQAAHELLDKGIMWKACEAFESLASRFPSQPSILWNLAVLRLRLGNPHLSSLAWRAFAALPSVSAEEAVEALMVAEYLEPRNPDLVDGVIQVIPLTETDRAVERMLSDRRLLSQRREIEEWDNENGPPPKAVFLVSDRPLQDNSLPTTPDKVPMLFGRLAVFGRQTDRSAQVELSIREAKDVPAVHALLRELCGESLGEPGPLEVVARTPLIDVLFTPMLAIVPDKNGDPGADRTAYGQVVRELIRKNMAEILAVTPLKALDGKTPRDAMKEPGLRLRLRAILSLADQRARLMGISKVFAELFEQLGLPPEKQLSGPELDINSVPLYQLHLVDVDSQTDESLRILLLKAKINAIRDVERSAAIALLARPGFNNTETRLVAWDSMVGTSERMAEALENIEKLAAECKAMGRPTGEILLKQLQLLIYSGQSKKAAPLISEIQRDFGSDKDVQTALYNLLKPFMRRLPDGRVSLMLPVSDSEAAAEAAAKQKTSGLWTPDQGPPVVGGPLTGSPSSPVAAPVANAGPTSGPAKSKLWIPGMD